jgi:hypothetical protein
VSTQETLAGLDVLADHLRNPGIPVEQKVEALLGLEEALRGFPGSGDAGSGSDRNLDRSRQISEMTQLGELSGLSDLESLIDADVRQRLLGLCRKPMSKEAEVEFGRTLDQVTHAAQADAARLQGLIAQNERDSLHRDLLRDMQSLLDLLAGAGQMGAVTGGS